MMLDGIIDHPPDPPDYIHYTWWPFTRKIFTEWKTLPRHHIFMHQGYWYIVLRGHQVAKRIDL